MTRTFSDGHPKVLPACNFLSQYYFYNIFLQKSCRFSLQTLTKFEAAKTGSGVGFLRLTAVCPSPAPTFPGRAWFHSPQPGSKPPWSMTQTADLSPQTNPNTARQGPRAPGRSREKKSNLAGFSGTNSRKKRPISRESRGNFRGQCR